MKLKFAHLLPLVVFPVVILTGCGTFEIGIESNTNADPAVHTVEVPLPTSTLPPTEEPAALPEPTARPEQSDLAEIEAALAQKLGTSIGEIPVAVTQIMDDHALGNVDNGYFLAAKQEGNWVIVYDGQAAPPCREVDFYDFPQGMVPECLGADNQLIVRSGSVDSLTSSLLSLECLPGNPGANPGTLEYVGCNIQDGLRSRNTSALLGYMDNPFIIGYWLSEGVMGPPEEMMQTIQGLYNYRDENYVPRLTFTTDRALFPELDGRSVEGNFGPDVNVVEVIYSQGWGEGDSEALIYISQDPAGNFKWHSMLIGDLDVPVPGS
jgi:hypothetical protein